MTRPLIITYHKLQSVMESFILGHHHVDVLEDYFLSLHRLRYLSLFSMYLTSHISREVKIILVFQQSLECCIVTVKRARIIHHRGFDVAYISGVYSFHHGPCDLPRDVTSWPEVYTRCGCSHRVSRCGLGGRGGSIADSAALTKTM